MELNIVEIPKLNATRSQNGEKPLRFVKRHRFKAKRERQGDTKVGLGSLRIKEAPLVGPEPTASGQKPRSVKINKPQDLSSTALVLGKKRKLRGDLLSEQQEHEVDGPLKRRTISHSMHPTSRTDVPVVEGHEGKEMKSRLTDSASTPVALGRAPSSDSLVRVSENEEGKRTAHCRLGIVSTTSMPRPSKPSKDEDDKTAPTKTRPPTKASTSREAIDPSSRESSTAIDLGPGGSRCGSPFTPLCTGYSRKNPAPASAARLDEFHIKPSELDMVTAAVPTGRDKEGATASTSDPASARKRKISKHIFTATPFSGLGLHEHLIRVLEAPREHHGLGLRVATRVQSAALPALLQSARPNALICSETGSGKTLAYLLPILQHLQALQPRPSRAEGTRAIIVAPTRELSHQIYDVLSLLVRAFIWIVPGLVSGGEKRKSEKARLRKGVTVLVGTPGRLLDHLQNSQAFRHEATEWLVLDEVDRLLDLGFEAQVREIVEKLRTGREGGSSGQEEARARVQVLAASATLTAALDKFGCELLGQHVRIDAKTGTVVDVDVAATPGGGEMGATDGEGGGQDGRPIGGKDDAVEGRKGENLPGDATPNATSSEMSDHFTTPVQLIQQYMVVTCKLRLPALISFLRVHAKSHKTVIFCSTCDSVDFHYALFETRLEGNERGADKIGKSSHTLPSEDAAEQPLLGSDMPVYRLHGNIPQAARLLAFKTFRQAPRGVLFCTDVAARGLDLPAVDWIVQYDPPTETAEYVHRVGRTARRGRQGHSILFLLPSEQGYLNVLKNRGITLTPLSLQQTLFEATPARFKGRFRAPEEVFCLDIQQQLERAVATAKEERGMNERKRNPSSPLLALGRKAFGSFVRAYATHPADLKPIFAVRALHLGHVAKSFALKEPPTLLKVGKEVMKISSQRQSASEHDQNGKSKHGGDDLRDTDSETVRKMATKNTQKAFQSPRKQSTGSKRRSRTAFSSVSEFSAG